MLLGDERVIFVDDNYAIQINSRNGHTEIVKLLLKDFRVNPAANDNNAIKLSSVYGHVENIKVLLKDPRVNPAADNDYAVEMASQNGHVEIVKLLLKDLRVNPAAEENKAIQFASQNGHTEIVKLLLKNFRVNPATNNNTPIRTASIHNHVGVVKVLLEDSRVHLDFATQITFLNAGPDIAKLLLKHNLTRLANASRSQTKFPCALRRRKVHKHVFQNNNIAMKLSIFIETILLLLFMFLMWLYE